MFNRSAIGFSLPILVLSLAVLPAFAHHGWGGNQNEEFEIAGTVAKGVSLAGPHATMQINVDGQVWDITLAPPARTSRADLTEEIIPMGAEVTIYGHRNRDLNRFEIKAERVMWNGQMFNVYPNRS